MAAADVDVYLLLERRRMSFVAEAVARWQHGKRVRLCQFPPLSAVKLATIALARAEPSRTRIVEIGWSTIEPAYTRQGVHVQPHVSVLLPSIRASPGRRGDACHISYADRR